MVDNKKLTKCSSKLSLSVSMSQECQPYLVSYVTFIPSSSQPDLLMVSTCRFHPLASKWQEAIISVQ